MRSLPAWASPEALLDLVEELRRAGYNVGIEQHILARELYVLLAAEGESFEQPGRIRGLLRPLLCSNPREQRDFGERFDRWIRRTTAAAERTDGGASAAEASLDDELETYERGLRWWRWVALALLLALIVAVLLVSTAGASVGMAR